MRRPPLLLAVFVAAWASPPSGQVSSAYLPVLGLPRRSPPPLRASPSSMPPPSFRTRRTMMLAYRVEQAQQSYTTTPPPDWYRLSCQHSSDLCFSPLPPLASPSSTPPPCVRTRRTTTTQDRYFGTLSIGINSFRSSPTRLPPLQRLQITIRTTTTYEYPPRCCQSSPYVGGLSR